MANFLSTEEIDALIEGKAPSRSAISGDPMGLVDLEDAKKIGDYKGVPGRSPLDRRVMTPEQQLLILRDQRQKEAAAGEVSDELEREIKKLERQMEKSGGRPAMDVSDPGPAAPKRSGAPEGHYASNDDMIILMRRGEWPPKKKDEEVKAEKPKEEDSGVTRRVLGDTAIDLAKGVVGTGESAVGIADLFTFGGAGKALAAIGYDPKEANKMLSEMYTPQRKRANENVEAAKGFLEAAGAYITNPSVLIGSIAESAPGMAGIVGGGRMLATNIFMKAAKSGGKVTVDAAGKVVMDKAAEEAGKAAVKAALPKIAAASAAGEGALGGGSIAEQARQAGREWEDYVLPSLGATATTAGISMASAGLGRTKIGQKLGLGDPETTLATAGMGQTGARTAPGAMRQGIKEGVGGFVTEGALEEMPQSATEQMYTNLAMGKPVGEGVGEAAAAGLLTGGVMGGGIGAARGVTRRAPEAEAGAAATGTPATGAPPAEAAAPGAPPPGVPPIAAEAPLAAGQIDPTTGEPVKLRETKTNPELAYMAKSEIEELAARARKESTVKVDSQGPLVEPAVKLDETERKQLTDLRQWLRTKNYDAIAAYYEVDRTGKKAPAPVAETPAAPAAAAPVTPAVEAPAAAEPAAAADATVQDLKRWEPGARAAADAAGLNVFNLKGSGKFNRITTADVDKAIKARDRAALRAGAEGAAKSEPSIPVGRDAGAVAADPAVQRALKGMGFTPAVQEGMPDADTEASIEVSTPDGVKKSTGTRIGTRSAARLQRFAKLFGKELAFFDQKPGTWKGDGFYSRETPNVIYLSSVAQAAPHMVIFGHELFHALEHDMPKVFARLKSAVKKHAGKGTIEGFKRDYTLPLENEEAYWNEIVSDIGGNRLQEVETWEKIFKGMDNHGMVMRVAQYVREMIGNAINFAKRQAGFQTDDYIKDLEGVREAVSEAAIAYIKHAQTPPRAQAAKQVVNAKAQAQPPPSTAPPPAAETKAEPQAKGPTPAAPAAPAVKAPEPTTTEAAEKAKTEPVAPKKKETAPAKAKREKAEKKAAKLEAKEAKVAKPPEPEGLGAAVSNSITDARQAWNDLENLRQSASELETYDQIEAKKALALVEDRIKQLEEKEDADTDAEVFAEEMAPFVLEDWQKGNPRPTIRKATAVQIGKLPDNVRQPYKSTITNYAAAAATAYGKALEKGEPQEVLDQLRAEFEWAGEQIKKQFPKVQYDSFLKHTKSPDDYDPQEDEGGESDEEDYAEHKRTLKAEANEKGWMKLPKEVTQTADGFRAIGPPISPAKLGMTKMVGDWKIYREINGIKKGDVVVATRDKKAPRTGTVAMVGVVSGEDATTDGKPVTQIAVWFDEELGDGDMFEVGMLRKASDKDYPSKEMVEKIENAKLADYPVKPPEEVFPAPKEAKLAENAAKKTHGTQMVKGKERAKFISQAEAKKLLESWKKEAERIGVEEDHSNDVIFSLFDYSGQWSQPWVDAGYHVIKYDVKNGDDLLRFLPIADIAKLKAQGKRIVGVLAAPPCTSFTSTGNQWWQTQHDVPVKEETMTKKYGFAANKYFDTPLDYAQTLVHTVEAFVEFANPERFHVLENPVGRIRKVTGLPEPLLNMQPHHYGDPYTKNTLLWGDFNADLPTANVNPALEAGGQGSLMHTKGSKAEEEGGERSLTPEGFSYSFFMANRADLKKPVQAAVKKSRVQLSAARASMQAITDSPIGEQRKAEIYAKANQILPFTTVEEVVIPANVPVQMSAKRAVRDPFGLERNENGTVTLYQTTTNERARAAAREQRLVGNTPSSKRIYLSSRSLKGEADVLINVDPALLHFVREHKDGSKEFFIPVKPGKAFERKMLKKLKLHSITTSRETAISADRTIKTIGDGITKAVASIQKMTEAEREANLERARELMREEHNVGTLLTENGKLEKTRINELGALTHYDGLPVASYGVGMAAAQKLNESRLTTCPQSARCESLCLGEFSGNNFARGGKGDQRAGPRQSQYLKTEALVLHPEEFTALLMDELDGFVQWAASPLDRKVRPDATGKRRRVMVPKEIYKPSIRLNVTTDFPGKMWEALINAYPQIMFYDYTKLVGQKPVAPNHHITYSSNGASQILEGGKVVHGPGNNWKQMLEKLRSGFNVAMAFDSKEDIPQFLTDAASGETFKVHDGDDYDARFLDPPQPDGRGMIIGLRNKDASGPSSTATERTAGFFVHYDRLMGDTVTIPDQDKAGRAVTKTIPIVAMPPVAPAAPVPEPRAPPREKPAYHRTPEGPRLTGNTISLRNPTLTTAQIYADQGITTYKHNVRRDGKTVGEAILGWDEDGKVGVIHSIEWPKDLRRQGIGTQVVGDIVTNNGADAPDILLHHVQDEALPFWSSMGVAEYEKFEGDTYGYLSKAQYDSTRGGEGSGRAGEGVGDVSRQPGSLEAGVTGGDRARARRDATRPVGWKPPAPAGEDALDFTQLSAPRAQRTAAQADRLDEELDAVTQAIRDQFPGVRLDAHINHAYPGGELFVSHLVVPEAKRGEGIGHSMMEQLFDWADEHDLQVSLDPRADKGKKGALARFYKDLGFISSSSSRGYDPASYGELIRPALRDRVQLSAPREPEVKWYSELARKIEAGPNTAPAAAWKGYINGLTQKGVKPEEIQWSGIGNFIDANVDAGIVNIPKQKLVEFLQNNGLGVEERVQGGGGAEFDASFGSWQEEEPEADYFKENAEQYMDQARETLQKDRDQFGDGDPLTDEEILHGAIQLARGAYYDDPERPHHMNIDVDVNGKTYKFVATQSYGEFDLFAPANQGNELDAKGGEAVRVRPSRAGRIPDNPQIERAIRDYLGEALNIDFDEEAAPFVDYTLPGGTNYRIHKLILPAGFTDSSYRSPHFTEGNILAHIRTKDRVDADGKKVLFIEEIQSDWAQEGREKGFSTGLTPEEGQERKDLSMILNHSAVPLNAEQKARLQELTDRANALPSAPFVQKTDSWVTLAMKRMLMKAVDEGFDKIAWTTGEQQADRYNLSKYISEIKAKRQPSGMVWLEAKGKDGRVIVSDAFKKERLPSVVGKEMAQKIARATELTAKTLMYTGLELEVGGEGMKTFYDQIVAKIGNEQLKKLGGEKVGTVEVQETGLKETYQPGIRKVTGSTQPGFDITPAMKASMKKGVPLFSAPRRDRAALVDEVSRAPSVKFGLEPDFESMSGRFPQTGSPDDVTDLGVKTFKTTRGNAYKAHEFAAYDKKGKLVGVASIVTDGDAIGAAKITVRDNARRQGWASRLIDTAEAAGIDVRGNLAGNRFTAEGRAFATNYLQRPSAFNLPEGEDVVYHVTRASSAKKIKEQGFVPFKPSNWTRGGDEAYGRGSYFAFENLNDAIRWAGRMDYAVNDDVGSGKIAIIAVKRDENWSVDESDPVSQLGAKGKWLARPLDKPIRKTAILAAEPVSRQDIRLASAEHFKQFKSVQLSAPRTQTHSIRTKMPGSLVTKTGKPWKKLGDELTLYHSSTSVDDVFEVRNGMAGHFGTVAAANDRIEHNISDGREVEAPRILPVHLAIKKPVRMTDVHFDEYGTMVEDLVDRGVLKKSELPIRYEDRFANGKGGPYAGISDVIELLKEKGYDGIVYKNNIEDRGSDTYIPFDPEQIVSAFEPKFSAPRREREPLEAWQEERRERKAPQPPFGAVELLRLPPDLVSQTFHMLKEGKSEQEVFEILDAMNVKNPKAALELLKKSAFPVQSSAFRNIRGVGDMRVYIADAFANATISPGFMRKSFDVISDALRPTVPGEFNWWHRTIGTQFHKAMVNPHFRKVFELAQRFLDHVSMFAIRAEKMAPSIFPSLGRLRHGWRAGMGLSRADNQLIGRALAEGTLENGPSPHNGKVWTDAELISRYNMTDKQRGYYREARAAIDQSLDDTAKALMVQLARSAKAPQAVLESILERYQPLDTARSQILAVVPATKAGATVAKQIDKIAKETANLKLHGYSPLMRFGRFTVTVKDAAGDTKFFSLHETKAERTRMQERVQRDPKFAGMAISVGEMNEAEFKLFEGVSTATMEAFVSAMPYTSAQQEEARQKYLNYAVSNRSAMARIMRERKGTEGYDHDATRTIASFITSNARYGSQAVNGSQLFAAAANIPQGMGNVGKEAMNLREYIMNPSEGAPGWRGFLFFQYLGASLAAGLVNLTQPVMMTLPYLAQYGTRRAVGAMAAGTKDTLQWLKSKTASYPALQKALERAAEQGIIEPQEIFQLIAAAQKGTSSFLTAKLMRLWGTNFAVTEILNRTITFAAAFRVGESMGHADPYAFAVKAVQDSQGLYNKGNRPNWARETGIAGTVGTIAFTFKQYSIAYIEFLKRLYDQGVITKPGFMLALGTLFLAAGAEGMPGADDLDDILETAAAWAGFPLNMKKQKRKFLRETLGMGKLGSDLVLGGISSMPFMPLDVQGRLGMANLIPGTAFFNPTRKDEAGKEALEVLGVTGSVFRTGGEAFDKLKTGDLLGAGKTMLPKALKDIAEGITMASTGRMIDKQDRLTMKVGPGDALVKALGFNPIVNAQEQEILGIEHTDKKIVQAKKQEWNARLAKAVAEQDDKTRSAILKEREAWNAKYPDYRIDLNWPAINRRAQAMRATRAERFVKSAPREIRGEARRQLLNREE